MAKLLSNSCILVDNTELIVSFFRDVFGIGPAKSSTRPMHHSIIQLSSDDSILLIQKSSCTPAQISYFGANCAVARHIFMIVKDPTNVLKIATQAGGHVTESNCDDNGDSYIVFEGPETITFHVTNEHRAKKLRVHDILLNGLGSDQLDDGGRSRAETVTKSRTIPRAPKNLAPIIPTLDCSILSNLSKNYIPCPPNSRKPVPFETEFFKGIALLVVRTKPEDPHCANFFGPPKRRMFEVQVQGKFKRMPIGEIFCGAESSSKMELGLITRSISKAACNFAGTMVNDLHYSFGDSPSQANYQLPHIVAPLFPTVDKLVVTPAGEEPPPLGSPFIEDAEFRKQRLKCRAIADANIDLTTVYSFSVNTSNLDLTAWTLVGIPMVKPMDLRTFFGDASIRLVAYEIPKAVLQASPNIHPVQALNYAFNIKLSALDADKAVDLALEAPEASSDDHDDDDDDDDDQYDRRASTSSPPIPETQSLARGGEGGGLDGARGIRTSDFPPHETDVASDVDSDAGSEPDPDGPDDGVIDFGDCEDGEEDKPTQTVVPEKKSRFLGARRGSVGDWFRKRLDDITPDTLDVPETVEYAAMDYESESFGCLRYCPMSIEVNDKRLMREGRRRTIYLLPWGEAAGASTALSALLPRFRAYSEMTKIFHTMTPIPKMHRNKKLSMDEKKRRHITESYRGLLTRGLPAQIAQTQAQLGLVSDIDKAFLEHHHVSAPRFRKSSPGDKHEGPVVLALSSRSWSEHTMRLTRSDISLVRGGLEPKLHSSISIPVTAIFNIRTMRAEETPLQGLPGLAFFQIETFNRIYYIMVREKNLSDWMTTFTTFFGDRIVSDHPEGPMTIPSVAEHLSFFARPSSWKLDHRRVANYRRIVFHPNNLTEAERGMSPSALIEDLLHSVFSLAAAESSGHSNANQWVAFSDKLAILQVLDFSQLRDNERVSFLLNLYHVMIVHGSLVRGPPSSWAVWQAFFNTSYMLSFEVVSIAELEHNLLRAAMSRPSPLLSKIAAPQSHYPGMALTQKDFRLNFCINNGSVSNYDSVPVYNPETLDQQLDETTMRMLAANVVVDSHKRLVILPRVCSWFLADFSFRRHSNPVPTDCLRVIAPYLKSDDRSVVMRLLADGPSPSVKFKNFNFRCRMLSLRFEEVAAREENNP